MQVLTMPELRKCNVDTAGLSGVKIPDSNQGPNNFTTIEMRTAAGDIQYKSPSAKPLNMHPPDGYELHITLVVVA